MRKQLLFLLTFLFSLSATQLHAEGNWSDDVSAITPERDDLVYRIETPQELAWVAQEVNNGTLESKVFILVADINLEGKEWTPIGNGSHEFTGYFRGNNHTISNLTITKQASGYAGLFGNSDNAEISDLILTDVNIVNVSFGTGALIGNSIYTNVKNCHVEGYISTVCGNPVSTGGLIGFAQHAVVDGSSADIDFTVVDSETKNEQYSLIIGGIAGSAVGGITLRNSSSIGEIKRGEGEWSNNFLKTFKAGGLIGRVTDYYDYVVENSFSACSIDLADFPTQSSTEISVGGLVGYVYSPNEAEKSAKVAFSNSFYNGTITPLGTTSEAKSNNVGTIAGNGNSKMTFGNSFYPASSTAIGDNIPSSTTGLAEIQENLADQLNGWVQSNNAKSEYLSWNTVGGAVSLVPEVVAEANTDYAWEDDICILKTQKGLLWFASQVNKLYDTFEGKTVKLAEGEWDMTYVEWTSIGLNSAKPASYFSGTFDGSNQTVKFKIGTESEPVNASYQGFFGYIKNGNVKDVTVEGNLYNKSGNSGIVVAQMHGGTISGVTSKGILSGSSVVGGIVSYAIGCDIMDCVNEAKVTGRNQSAGGIVGSFLKGKIEHCMNGGSVTGGAAVGGVIGRSEGNAVIADCINSGDVQASGSLAAGGVIGMLNTMNEQCDKDVIVINVINRGKVSLPNGQAVGGIVGLAGDTGKDKKDISFVNCGNCGDISGSNLVGGIGTIQMTTGRSGSIESCFNIGEIITSGYGASTILRNGNKGYAALKNSFYKGQEGLSSDLGTIDSKENVSLITDGSWLDQLNKGVEAYNAIHPDGPFAKTWKFDADNNPVFGLSAPVIEGKTPFNQQTIVTITASTGAKIYYTLDGSEPMSGSTLYAGSITLSEQKTVKAIAVMDDLTSEVAEKEFVPGNFFAVTVSPNDAAMGSVTISTDATPEEGGLYPEGAKLTLTATPNSGYHFNGWSDGHTANPYELTVAGEVALVANFEKDAVIPPYVPSYYDISFEPNDSVLLSANATTVEEGYSFVVKAEVAEGYDPSTLVVEYKSGRTGRWKTVEPSANGTYRIRNVYNDIYVRASVEPADDPTANAVVEGGNRIYAVRDVVYIDRLVPVEAQVLTIGGRIVRNQHLYSGSNRITGLQPGVYVVRLSDGSCRKVSVR